MPNAEFALGRIDTSFIHTRRKFASLRFTGEIKFNEITISDKFVRFDHQLTLFPERKISSSLVLNRCHENAED